MNLAYTTQITINGEHVLKKGTDTGNIPSTIRVRAIAIWPVKSTTYPQYQIKGIGDGSAYITIEPEMPVFEIDGGTDDVGIYCYIKTGSSIVFNVAVKGTT